MTVLYYILHLMFFLCQPLLTPPLSPSYSAHTSPNIVPIITHASPTTSCNPRIHPSPPPSANTTIYPYQPTRTYEPAVMQHEPLTHISERPVAPGRRANRHGSYHVISLCNDTSVRYAHRAFRFGAFGHGGAVVF